MGDIAVDAVLLQKNGKSIISVEKVINEKMEAYYGSNQCGYSG